MFGYKKTFWNTDYKGFTKTYRDPVMQNNRILTNELMMSIDRQKTRRNGNIFLLTNKCDARNWLCANILQANSNYVIPDADGEIYEDTHEYLRNQGYQVHVLNLSDPDTGIHYNPLSCLQQSDGNYQRAIEEVVGVLTNSGNTSDPFQKKNKEVFLRTVLHYIKTLPEEQQTFETLWSLFPDPHLRKRTPWNGGIMQTSSDAMVLRGLNVLQQVPYIMLAEALADMPMLWYMQNVVREAEAFDMTQLTKGKHAVFLVYKSDMAWHPNLISLFYAQLLEMLYAFAEKSEKKKLDTPWLFYSNQWHLDLAKKMSTCSKYNIFFAVNCAVMAELKYLYPYEWDVIPNICDVLIYAPSIDCHETEWIMQMLNHVKKPGDDNSQEAICALQALSPSQCVVFVRGMLPFCCEKYNWKQHPNAGEIQQ